MSWDTDQIMRIMVLMQDGIEIGLIPSPEPQGHLTPQGPLPMCIISMEEGSIWASIPGERKRILLVPRKESI